MKDAMMYLIEFVTRLFVDGPECLNINKISIKMRNSDDHMYRGNFVACYILVLYYVVFSCIS
jgi:hypothetical protein